MQTFCRVEFEMRIATTAQIRDLESNWIKQCDEGWGQVLMEIAGRGAAIRALRMWQENPGEVVVVCGKGNNGGDGLVVARYLTLWGVPVKVWLVSQDRKQSDDVTSKEKAGSGATTSKSGSVQATAASVEIKPASQTDIHKAASSAQMRTRESSVNKSILESLHVPVRVLHERLVDDQFDAYETGSGSDPDVDEIFDGTALIVDALFGTGLTQPIEGLYKRVIDAINRSAKRVLAIDIPSGINSDTGQIMGAAVRADQTISFGYLKPGLLTHPGATLAGRLGICDIGLPELPESSPDLNLLTVEIVREILPLRPSDSHKGTFGHVLLIAGSTGMAGAAMLASHSALRVGAGLAYLAAPKSLVNYLPPEEVIYRPMPESGSGTLSLDAYEAMKTHIANASAIVLGPGLGLNDDTIALVEKLIGNIDCPCVIDADGLNAISKKPSILQSNEGTVVLTPHPKELARLLDCNVSTVQSDRIGQAINAAKKFNCVVVLKGSMSVIANPTGEVFINPTGNPAMATAGAGDVLSGIIGGLLAQRVDPFQAAACGVYIHGRAGDILSQELGESGIVAGDLKRLIPFAVESIRAGDRSNLESMLLTDGSD